MDDDNYDETDIALQILLRHEKNRARVDKWVARFNSAENDHEKMLLAAEAMRDDDFHYRWLLLLFVVPDVGPIRG